MLFYFVNRIETANNLTKNYVLSIALRSGRKGDEELRRVGVLPRIPHRQNAALIVLQIEAVFLVLELFAINRLPPGAIVEDEIASLHHEACNYAVEETTFVGEFLAAFTECWLTSSTEPLEVGDRKRANFVVEFKDDARIVEWLSDGDLAFATPLLVRSVEIWESVQLGAAQFSNVVRR